jgi:hypothetical protein
MQSLPESGENMPTEVTPGQTWSTWVPGRHQWLLATVMRLEKGLVTLKYDARYGIGNGYEEHRADETDMLTNTNLFRFLESGN